MSLTMQVEINSFDELMEHSWSGALDNLKLIDKYGLQDEFMSYLEEMFCDSTPTDTEINDFIWFMENPSAEEFIAEHINVYDVEDLDELEDYAKNLCFTDAVSPIWESIISNKEELLWNYIKNNYDHYNLREVFEELETLDIDDIEDEEE